LIAYFSRHYPTILAFDLEQAGAAEKATQKIEELLSAGEISQKFAF